MLSVKILEIHRLNRKIRVEDEIKYVSSRTLCIKLVGQTLPQCVNIFNHKYPVFPYIPKARISCFHVGHLSKVCKSQTRCVTCGGQKHDSLNDCPLKLSPPKCVNCGESHLATSHECPEVIRHKMALSLISSTNISYSEAKKVYSPYILLHPFLPLLIPGMISIISLTLGGSVFLHDFFEIIGVKLHCSLDALIHIFNVYRHPNSQTPHRILNNFFTFTSFLNITWFWAILTPITPLGETQDLMYRANALRSAMTIDSAYLMMDTFSSQSGTEISIIDLTIASCVLASLCRLHAKGF